MEPRTMPYATFVCQCGEQTTVQLALHVRSENRQDYCQPHPYHHGQPMVLLQVDYGQGVQ